MSVGKRIKEVRIDKNMTIRDFATSLSIEGKNIDRGNISRYENDLISPTFDFFYCLLKVFNVNLNWLICGNGEIYNDDIERIKRRYKRDRIIKKNVKKSVH